MRSASAGDRGPFIFLGDLASARYRRMVIRLRLSAQSHHPLHAGKSANLLSIGAVDFPRIIVDSSVIIVKGPSIAPPSMGRTQPASSTDCQRVARSSGRFSSRPRSSSARLSAPLHDERARGALFGPMATLRSLDQGALIFCPGDLPRSSAHFLLRKTENGYARRPGDEVVHSRILKRTARFSITLLAWVGCWFYHPSCRGLWRVHARARGRNLWIRALMPGPSRGKERPHRTAIREVIASSPGRGVMSRRTADDRTDVSTFQYRIHFRCSHGGMALGMTRKRSRKS